MVQKVVDELSRARARDCRLAASSLPPHHAWHSLDPISISWRQFLFYSFSIRQGTIWHLMTRYRVQYHTGTVPWSFLQFDGMVHSFHFSLSRHSHITCMNDLTTYHTSHNIPYHTSHITSHHITLNTYESTRMNNVISNKLTRPGLAAGEKAAADAKHIAVTVAVNFILEYWLW